MKKFLTALIFLLIAIPSLFLLKRVISFSNDTDPNKTFLFPQVEIAVIKVSYLDEDSINMNIRMLIKSHFPFDIKADSFKHTVYISNLPLLESTYNKSIELKNNDSSWVSLPLTIHINDLDSLLTIYEKENIDSVEYKMKASFYTDIIFTKKYNVTINKFLPMIHLLKIEVDSSEIDNLDLSGATINLFISLKNNNVFNINLKNLAWKFSIENYPWMEGMLEGITQIPSHSKKEIAIPLQLSFLEAGKTLLNLLTRGNKVDFGLQLSFNIVSENRAINDSRAILKTSGKLKTLLKKKEIKS